MARLRSHVARRVVGLVAVALIGLGVLVAGLAASSDRASAASTKLYDQMNDGAWSVANSSNYWAQSFTTSSTATALTSVEVWIRNNSGSGSSYGLALYSSSSGTPGTSLTTIVASEPVGAWGDGRKTFTLATPYALAASTQYFIVMSGPAGGSVGWKCNAAAPTTDVSPAPTFVNKSSSNSGSSWSAVGGGCAGNNYNLIVTGAIAVAPTLGTFANVNATVGDTAQTITAPTVNTAGSFSYSSSDTAVATVSGSTLAFAGAGTSTITATFTPDDTTNWTTATTTMTVTVASPPPSTTTSTTSTTTSTTSTTTTTVPGPPAPTASTTTTVAPAVVPAPTTTTSTTTTTVPTRPTGEFPAPAPIEPNDNIFGDSEGEQVAVVIDTRVGERAAGAPVRVSAVALRPNTEVTVTVFSDPQVLLVGTSDANGNFEGSATLPDLEPGRHTVLVESTGRNGEIQVAGAILLDDEGFVDRLAQPAVLTGFTGPDDARLTRALSHDRPVWDVAARPLTTAAITVSAVSLLAFAGAAGLSAARTTAPSGGLATGDAGVGAAAATAAGDGERRRRSRARLASVVTKKLKGIQIDSVHRGDVSGTWGMPGTARTDAFSRGAPVRVGPWSAVLPRILVDGAWARAMFGSFGFALWPVGVAVALLAAFTGGSTAVVPAFSLLLVMVVIGILDAGAGACAWVTLVIASIIGGQIEGWPDVRALMGLGILLSTISLLAHVIRPLRRYVATNRSETWERIFDYVMMPVFVAFAAGAMLKALNGLSGLQIVSTGQIADLRWAVYFTVIARLAVEDVAAHLYPERMRMVQPEKLASQRRPAAGVAIVVRSAVFLFIAEPFFGLTATTVIAAFLLALPVTLKLWEDDLPNSAILNKWFPRGLFRFFCLTLLGMYLTSVFIGRDGGDAAVKSSFLWLLLPGVSEGVIELFGRHGGHWPNVLVKRTLGAVVWIAAVSVVIGLFTPFI